MLYLMVNGHEASTDISTCFADPGGLGAVELTLTIVPC